MRELPKGESGRNNSAQLFTSDVPDMGGRVREWERFLVELRARKMGAWRRERDPVTGRVSEAGKRTPDRVVPPIPGVPNDGPHEVVASGTYIHRIKR